jgi:steroid delta-isomerase-like uncharacterized protein
MQSARSVAAANVDAFNAHDEQRLAETIAEDAVLEAPGDVRTTGREATTQYAMGWLRAFPDGRLTVHNELEADTTVVQEFTFEGTHEDTLSGPARDVPATHRRLTGRGVQILRIEDGLVAETRLYFDQVQVLTQLGLMPEPAAATA